MKIYAAHNDALARSLIAQVLAEIGMAWGDYEGPDGAMLDRGDIRALVRAAQGLLDEMPQREHAASALLPEFLRAALERAEAVPRDRKWSWREWMLCGGAWYADVLSTGYVRCRPGLRDALLALSVRHMAHIGADTEQSERQKRAFHVGRRQRREAAMVAGR